MVSTAALPVETPGRPARASGLLRPRALHFLPLPPGWPLTALLLLYPLWWALGLGVLIYPILAVPMAVALVRRGRVKVPPGFALWLLFLVTVVVSMVALEVDPAGTLRGTAMGRLPGVVLRLVEYAALTVLLLYAGNLTEKEMPQRRLIRLLGWSFVITVAGGLLGWLAPNFGFTAPLEYLLPEPVRENDFVQSLVHPAAAQLHQVLGYETPRPAAPWGYTNIWGNNYFILMIWFVVAWWVYARLAWQRLMVIAVLGVSVIPVLVSLNRGLWLGLGFAAVFVAARLALRGRLLPIAGLAGVATVIGVLLAVTPLGTMVAQRLQEGHSNDVRVHTTGLAVSGIVESPLIGFGSTRSTLGSTQSIAVGSTAGCERCGNHTIGSNGQFWLALYAHGILGLVLFTGFFLVALWRSWRDPSPIGIAASLVLLLNLLASFYYNTLITPLAFTFLSYVLVWRQQEGTKA